MLLTMEHAATSLDRAGLAAVRQCACFNIRKAARAVTQRYEDHLRPTGLRATQFSLLTVLAGMEKATITELADQAVMDRTTLKRNLELLQEQGLVRIRPGEDARVREVTLTRAAHQRLLEALPYWEAAQLEMIRSLGEGRLERMLADLSSTVAAAQQEA